MKRITLDAGQNLDRFESRYTGDAGGAEGAGGRHQEGRRRQVVFRTRRAACSGTWEPVKADGSHFGCGIIVDPPSVEDVAEADGNVLVVTTIAAGGAATYYAGFGWDRSGDFATDGDWDRYLDLAAQRIRSPLAVSVAAK